MMPRTRRHYYHVAPRYTCGSPACVDQHIAAEVANEELRAYDRYLAGIYGAEATQEASERGLGGIVERRTQLRGGIEVFDLLTNATRIVRNKR